MEIANITSAAYLTAALIYLALGLIYIFQSRSGAVHWSMGAACLGTLVWALAASLGRDWLTHQSNTILITELLKYTLWVFALSSTLHFLSQTRLPVSLRKVIYGCAVIALFVILFAHFSGISNTQTLYLMTWSGLLMSVIGLICTEQLYKNVVQNRQIKLLCLNVGAMFIFDIYLYANNLSIGGIDPDLSQARAIVSVATGTILTIGAVTLNAQSQESATLSFSRPIVFYTTSLTASGIFITVLAVGGYYVRNLGGNWGSVIYTLFLFLTLMTIAIVFTSSTAREFLSVLINKHFFRHKYDYRTEWLKLIKDLSKPTLPGEVNKRALQVVSDIVKCHGGALWLQDDEQYKMVYQQGLAFESAPPFEPAESDFCTILRKQQWVFIPQSEDDSTPSRYNEYLPSWLTDLPNIWLVLPLLSEHELYGFILLEKPRVDTSLTWEDRDLLKTVGRQVASYLERHNQALQLAESSQFDAFNRLSAFIMHDLKNLIAQQALVVQNAAKHKDNPAFIEDAINTIDNSVNRMSRLLQKLQRDQPAEIRSLSLNDILREATRKCQDKKPLPTLRIPKNNAYIDADKDRLVMAITHLIRNAQDATPNTGFIDVSLNIEDQMANIGIEDSGTGMDDNFVQNRLFKPFDSTKEGKGMGIGAYQAKEVATSLKGSLDVHSVQGEGTTFSLILPITSDTV